MSEELAYAAGIVDGEGCIGIYQTGKDRQRGAYYGIVRVVNCNGSLIRWLSFSFGGKPTLSVSRNPRHKDAYAWQLSGTRASAFLESVLPFLKLKRRQAELVISLSSKIGRKGVRLTLDECDRRRRLKTEIDGINRRGRP